MKSPLFATLAAVLLTATSAFAAPLAAHDRDHEGPRFAQGPGDRDANYGYAKNHRVTDQERARWEAQHKNDRRDNDRKGNDRKGNDRKDDKFDRNKNYGFDKNHRVTPQERARWEAQHKNDRHDNDHR